MVPGRFTAPCGCTWRDEQLERPCAAWPALVAERERVRRDWDAEYGQLRGVEERMAEHMPPWLGGQNTPERP